jgi:hypothetical protein
LLHSTKFGQAKRTKRLKHMRGKRLEAQAHYTYGE